MNRNHASQPFEFLIVDDEPGDVQLIKAAIADGKFPCRVNVANDGVEAMQFLRKEGPGFKDAPTPHLILLDINMPRMNGREVLKAVKADEHLARIPVVMMTTSEAEKDIASAYEIGAAGYVVKPINLEDFFNTVHALEDYWVGLVRTPTLPGS